MSEKTKFLYVGDVARRLHRSRETIRRWIRAGEKGPKFIKIGHEWVCTEEALMEYMLNGD